MEGRHGERLEGYGLELEERARVECGWLCFVVFVLVTGVIARLRRDSVFVTGVLFVVRWGVIVTRSFLL